MAYNKKTWANGDLITKESMNNIENGIYTAHDEIETLKNNTSTGGSNNASDISITDTGNYFTNSDVEGALQEVGSQIKEIANSGNISSIEPAEDDLPKVFFYGDISNMSKTTSVDLDFEYKSRTANYKGVANTKWQGSSSLSYNKKNYTIKLFTDNTKSSKLKLNIKGWGEQNKFCLKANYVDSLHVRNLAGARIAYDMIKSRSDFDSLPTELQQAPRCGVIDGFPIKVYINGDLMGLYTWNIPKDKWCSNMDENNVNHAFLMAEKNNNGSSADSLVLACEFRANATIFADTSTAQYPSYDWVVEGPGDDVSAEIRTSFNNLINCIKDTDDATFKATIGNYLDLTSAFDYYSFAYLMCHYDGLGKNLGMATYDGTKWFCTLYDMDSIFGATIDGNGFLGTDIKCPEQYKETNSLLWERIEKCFGAELYTRYKELRQGVLSLGNIFTHVEEIYDIIPDRLYAEDRAKWTSLPSVNTNTVARIRNYMRDRAVYVDAQMLEIGTKVPCTGITLSANSLSFTITDTQTITATVEPSNTTDVVTWSVSPAGIVTVDGGVVTPVANGGCTITAACGSMSATCSVNVAMTSVACTSISLDRNTLTFDLSSVGSSETIVPTYERGFLSRSTYGYNLDGGYALGAVIPSNNDITTDFIDITGTDSITISRTNTSRGIGVVAYDSNKNGVYILNINNGVLTWKTKDESIDDNVTPNLATTIVSDFPQGVKYIRFCVCEPSLDTITITKTTSVVPNTQTLVATVEPSDCTEAIVWSSNAPSIATVDNGLVTAKANGSAVITATCGSYSDTCTVTVSGIEEQPGNEPVTLTKTLTQGKGFNKTTGEVTVTGNSNYGICEEYISLIKGNTYTINGCGSWLTILGYNSDKTFNKMISEGNTVSTTYEFINDCDYIRVGCNLSSGTAITITGVFGK